MRACIGDICGHVQEYCGHKGKDKIMAKRMTNDNWYLIRSRPKNIKTLNIFNRFPDNQGITERNNLTNQEMIQTVLHLVEEGWKIKWQGVY